MSKAYRVLYSFEAAEDLRQIHAYIEQLSPQDAAGMFRRLLSAIDNLSLLPYRYPLRPVPGRPDVRSMPVRPYRVVYEVLERLQAVRVLTVRHGSRRS
ncbi:MAG: ParE toxin of type toxin-antitoxin system, parDE [Phycisphaerales bacterium]|nr:ParE toxin of type toxin-antitoxin system, parDE [Phycisphaerales bacterium]